MPTNDPDVRQGAPMTLGAAFRGRLPLVANKADYVKAAYWTDENADELWAHSWAGVFPHSLYGHEDSSWAQHGRLVRPPKALRVCIPVEYLGFSEHPMVTFLRDQLVAAGADGDIALQWGSEDNGTRDYSGSARDPYRRYLWAATPNARGLDLGDPPADTFAGETFVLHVGLDPSKQFESSYLTRPLIGDISPTATYTADLARFLSAWPRYRRFRGLIAIGNGGGPPRDYTLDQALAACYGGTGYTTHLADYGWDAFDSWFGDDGSHVSDEQAFYGANFSDIWPYVVDFFGLE